MTDVRDMLRIKCLLRMAAFGLIAATVVAFCPTAALAQTAPGNERQSAGRQSAVW